MSSEYGWTDNQIGELPLARFRQITSAIQLRKYSAQREENSRFSWLGRNLAGFIANGYMVSKGQENPGLKLAATLAYDDIEAAQLGTQKAQGAKENSNGSFERFMMTMGGGKLQR